MTLRIVTVNKRITACSFCTIESPFEPSWSRTPMPGWDWLNWPTSLWIATCASSVCACQKMTSTGFAEAAGRAPATAAVARGGGDRREDERELVHGALLVSGVAEVPIESATLQSRPPSVV